MITTFKSAISCSEEKVFPMYIYPTGGNRLNTVTDFSGALRKHQMTARMNSP